MGLSRRQIQRAITAVSNRCPHKLGPVFDAFYHALWVDGNKGHAENPENMVKVLASVMGENDAKIMMEAVRPPAIEWDGSSMMQVR